MKKLNVFSIVLGILILGGLVAQAVPQYMSYSARLVQNGKLPNGTRQFTFRMYDQQAPGGTLLWVTGNPTQVTVPIYNGVYDIDLGPLDPSVFANGNSVYLETTVGTETLLPRTKLNSMIFAMQAGGLAHNGASVSLNASGGIIVNAKNAANALVVSSNGNVGIGTTNPGTKLEVVGDINVPTGVVRPLGGTRVVYMCTQSGTLPSGALTGSISNCGSSQGLDTGLRIP
jgi:hypothetical protein